MLLGDLRLMLATIGVAIKMSATTNIMNANIASALPQSVLIEFAVQSSAANSAGNKSNADFCSLFIK
jgi:hypothetical protein